MTIVTTSRKPVPELRSLAKDLAFAIGCRYVLRGKMGLSAIQSIDPVFFLLSLEKKDFRIQLLDHGTAVADYLIRVREISMRPDEMVEGILLSNQSVYEELKPYIPVKLSGEPEGLLIFDGTRKRRYILRVAPHEA
jgi:U3 small nucleolar ribonucleoprotein protein IMP4